MGKERPAPLNPQTAMRELLSYCLDQNWTGYDPYDGLNSRLFQATPMRLSPLARMALIQVLKRSPINLRPLLGVPRVENPKGLALAASAAIRLARLHQLDQDLGTEMIERLLRSRSPAFSELCWGYPFDWQNRHFMLPRHQPNIICSTFGGHALLDAFDHYHNPAYLEASTSVAEFLLTHLNRTAGGNGDAFCFSYTPLDRGQVHNANLLGAAFLARLWHHKRVDAFKQTALCAARFTIDRQRADGAWVYGEAANQQWIDSFHTGYNVLALRTLHKVFDLPHLSASLERGYGFYRQHFFGPNGIARYYHDRVYPLDIHSIAQGIITLAQMADRDSTALPLASALLDWVNRHMRSRKGYYYYQKHRYWTIRIPYMRWSQAWMLLALATLLEATTSPRDIPEAPGP